MEPLNTSQADSELESLSWAELEEFHKVNAETIAGLNRDIDLLKWKLTQFGPDVYHEQELDVLLSTRNSEALEGLKEKLKKEINQYEDRLKETVRVTGVTVDKFSRHVQFLDDLHCVKEYTLEATVYNRRVLLSCTVDEEFSPPTSTPKEGKVTWFQIQFQEDIHNAIGEEIKKAAENLAHHSAFALLKSYLQWKKLRDDTVVNLSESNPKTVKLFTSGDNNYCLKITNPKPERPVFTVEWGRKLVEGRILPDVTLKVDTPERWTAIDTDHVMESAPQIFETMITTLGLEKALDAFVQLVATDGKGPQRSVSPCSQEGVS